MSECCINTMKSELIESIDKYKIISEMPLGRRKLQATKTNSQSLSLNGESLRLNAAEDVEISDNNNASSSAVAPTSSTEQIIIVAAMQDHISCTKLKSSTELNVVAKEEEMEKDLTKMTFELDHMYANCSSGVSLNSLAASHAHSAAAIVADDLLLPEHEQIRCLKELIVLHLDLISQEQSKSHMKDLEIQQLRKENETLKQQLRDVTKCRRKSAVGQRSGGDNGDSAEESGSESGEDGDGKRSSRRHRRGRRRRKGVNDAADDDEEDHRHRKKRKSVEEKNDNAMYSHQLYYTPVGDVKVTSENVVTASNVQVPGWRVRFVTSCYQMEGTENLDDDIFLKRHQKLEIDEKRRKRWDIQRIREQRMQERLLLGRQAKKKTQPTKNNSFNSFYPDADKVQMLEVSEVLPVSAFGRTVSRLHTSEFDLRWNG